MDQTPRPDAGHGSGTGEQKETSVAALRQPMIYICGECHMHFLQLQGFG